MLKSKDFCKIPQNIQPFIFESLHCVENMKNGQNRIYSDKKGNRFEVIRLPHEEISEIKAIDYLGKNKIILNYKGALRKLSTNLKDKPQYFIFVSVNEFVSLATYTQTYNTKTEPPSEKFCIELIQSMLLFFLELQKRGLHLKTVDPYTIGVRNIPKNNSVGFGLIYPFPQRFMRHFNYAEYEKCIEFCAPEIIRHFNELAINKKNKWSEIICNRQFRKASLYSLGLVIAFCFGKTFSQKERIEYSKNDRQLKGILKRIRKEIKTIHKGKYVAKLLKLLLEDCEKSRETLETFQIKMHSDQFLSLKITKNCLSMNQIKVTTVQTHSDGFDTCKTKSCKDFNTIYGSPKQSSIEQSPQNQNRVSSKVQNLIKNQAEDTPSSTIKQKNYSMQSVVDIQIQTEEQDDEEMWGKSLVKMGSVKSSDGRKQPQKDPQNKVEQNYSINFKYDFIGERAQKQEMKEREQLEKSPQFRMIQISLPKEEQQQPENIINYNDGKELQFYQKGPRKFRNSRLIKKNIKPSSLQQEESSNFHFHITEEIQEGNMKEFESIDPITFENFEQTQEIKMEEEQLISMERESAIRQNFHNESKLAMTLFLGILLVYALIGYFFINQQ